MDTTVTTYGIDPRLEAFLPDLDDETVETLERSIKDAKEVYDPIVVWKEEQVILDGHNRYRIANKLGLTVKAREVSLKTLDDAQAWMLENQLGRRNLTDEQLAYFRGKYLSALKRRGKKAQNAPLGKSSAQIAGEKFGRSAASMKRDETFAKGVDAIAKTDQKEAKKILTGQSKVNKAVVEEIGKGKEETHADKVAKFFGGGSLKPEAKPEAKPTTNTKTVTDKMVRKHEQDILTQAEKVLQASTRAGRVQALADLAVAVNKLSATFYDTADFFNE